MTFLVCLSATKLVIFKHLIGLWVSPETEPETRALVGMVNLGGGSRNMKRGEEWEERQEEEAKAG